MFRSLNVNIVFFFHSFCLYDFSLSRANVCGPRLYAYCCPGWQFHPGLQQCTKRKLINWSWMVDNSNGVGFVKKFAQLWITAWNKPPVWTVSRSKSFLTIFFFSQGWFYISNNKRPWQRLVVWWIKNKTPWKIRHPFLMTFGQPLYEQWKSLPLKINGCKI